MGDLFLFFLEFVPFLSGRMPPRIFNWPRMIWNARGVLVKCIVHSLCIDLVEGFLRMFRVFSLFCQPQLIVVPFQPIFAKLGNVSSVAVHGPLFCRVHFKDDWPPSSVDRIYLRVMPRIVSPLYCEATSLTPRRYSRPRCVFGVLFVILLLTLLLVIMFKVDSWPPMPFLSKAPSTSIRHSPPFHPLLVLSLPSSFLSLSSGNEDPTLAFVVLLLKTGDQALCLTFIFAFFFVMIQECSTFW